MNKDTIAQYLDCLIIEKLNTFEILEEKVLDYPSGRTNDELIEMWSSYICKTEKNTNS